MPSISPIYTLYGVPHSLYTAKVRCYLRNQGIAYRERPTADPNFVGRIVPLIGRAIIPVLETPDGQVIQDTVDIIDYFERQGVPYPAYPSTPLQRVLAVILEYYGGQGLLRHAMHYRWSYLEQQREFLEHAFASGSGAVLAQQVMARMQSYLPRLGVTEASIPLIEASYLRLLDILEAHFECMPYLLGGRPSLADYGMIGSLFAHLGRDPIPAQLMKLRSPRVFRWVERMTAPDLDVVEYLDGPEGLWPDDQIPPTLEPLLQHVAAELFPELGDKLAFLDAWTVREQPADGAPVTDKPHRRQIASVQTEFRGVPIETGVEPYLRYVLQRASDTVQALPELEQVRVMAELERVGLAGALPANTGVRVARRHHIEVWSRV